MPDPTQQQGQRPKLDFTAFVLSLGSSALINLGEAPDPESGQRLPPNLPLAQQSIDLIALLQEKTRGNLTADESRFVEQILYDLRMIYVTASQKAGPQAQPQQQQPAPAPARTP